MLLYLVQHGLAKTGEEDPLRPLSADGRNETERVAEHLGRLKLPLDVIVHSGKLRAHETAEIFSQILTPPLGMNAEEGLMPKDDPLLWRARLNDEGPNRMIVGHLPHLSNLASLLLAGREEHPVVAFRNSGVLSLERSGEGDWSVLWMITPHILSK